MEKYDLSTITRENLLFLLSTARDEMVKYTRCREDVEACERGISEVNNKIVKLKDNSIKGAIIGGIITVPFIAAALSFALIFIFKMGYGRNCNRILISKIIFVLLLDGIVY